MAYNNYQVQKCAYDIFVQVHVRNGYIRSFVDIKFAEAAGTPRYIGHTSASYNFIRFLYFERDSISRWSRAAGAAAAVAVALHIPLLYILPQR